MLIAPEAHTHLVEGAKGEHDARVCYCLASFGGTHGTRKLRRVDGMVAVRVCRLEELHSVVCSQSIKDGARLELGLTDGATAIDVELGESLPKHRVLEALAAFAGSHKVTEGLKVDLLLTALEGLC